MLAIDVRATFTRTYAHVAFNGEEASMTKQTHKPDTQPKAPTHTLFHIEERRDDKSFWTEVAVGWLNQDGSVNIRSSAGTLLLPGHDYQLRPRADRTNGNSND
jgi:hypothetical protein